MGSFQDRPNRSSGAPLPPRIGEAIPLRQEDLRSLLAGFAAITEDLGLEGVLERVISSACELVQARYGALGVIGADNFLSHFITVGLEDDKVRRIGSLPVGHGVLGQLITDPRPLRLTDLRQHPAAYGFPDHHPQMTSFLGVPIRVKNSTFGNLYLTEKRGGGDFTPADEELVKALAAAAGAAIENASLFDESRRRSRWLEAGMDTVRELVGTTEDPGLDGLDLVAGRAADVAGADLALVAVQGISGNALFCAAAAGPSAAHVAGQELAVTDEVLSLLDGTGPALLAGVARVFAPTSGLLLEYFDSTLAVRLSDSEGEPRILILLRSRGSAPFTAGDATMSTIYSSHVALALELVKAHRLREQQAVFGDRDRIARDLHDLVIQRLFAAGLRIQGLRRFVTDPGPLQRIDEVTGELDETIRELRDTIYSLRSVPQAGTSLSARILKLVEECATILPFNPVVQLSGPVDTAVAEDIADHLMAVISEGLSNAVRHAGASSIGISVDVLPSEVHLSITDDGRGIAPGAKRSGMNNMQRRAELCDGHFRVHSVAGRGTRLDWIVPAQRDLG